MTTRLVGRDHELAVLTGRLDGPAPPSAAFEVIGDAGMGKTTLLDAAAEAASGRGHTVLRLAVTEAEQALPWAGVGSLYPWLPAGAVAQLSVVQRLALAAALGEGGPRLATTGPYVAAALRHVLRMVGESVPVVLTIDDLHWLDAASAGALAVALRGAADLPLTVVAARRPSGTLPIELDRVVAHDHRVLELRGFDDAEVHQLLRERVGGPLTGSVLSRVARLAGGNPLYTVLLGEHATTRARGTLPGSIVGSYLRRLDAMTPDVVDVLEHAAILGRPAAATLVAACPDRDVPSALLAAEQAGLITGPPDALRFVHPLLPTALAERLGGLGRDRIHRRLADVVEDPELRAVHLAAATGQPDAEVASSLEAAAAGALERGARIEAGRRFERAGELTPVAERADLWRRALAAADAYLGGGDLERAARQARVAVDVAAEPAELALAGGVMVQVVASREGLHQAHEYVCSLLDQLTGHAFLRSFLNRVRARIEQTFDLTAALETAESSVAELRAAGDERAADAASVVADNCRFLLGLPTDPIAAWRLVEADADPTDALSSGWMATEMLVWDHRVAEARAVLERFERRAEALGNMLVELKLHDFRAALLARLGDLEATELELRRAVDCAELTGYPASMSTYGLARVMAATGRVDEAAALLDRDEPPSEELPVLHIARSHALGAMAAASGRWEDAVEHLRHAWSAAEKVGMGDLRTLPFRPDLVEALVRVGRVGDAAAATDRIEELAARSGAAGSALHAGRARLHVMVANGRFDDAVDTGTELLGLAQRLQLPIEHVRIGHLLGTAQRRAGRRREARATLTDARTTAARLQLVAITERIDEELARLGGRADPSALTPTEARVAELVATGRSNREVASELLVSLRTVESNLTRIYRKLGIRSRSELAAGYRTSKGADPP